MTSCSLISLRIGLAGTKLDDWYTVLGTDANRNCRVQTGAVGMSQIARPRAGPTMTLLRDGFRQRGVMDDGLVAGGDGKSVAEDLTGTDLFHVKHLFAHGFANFKRVTSMTRLWMSLGEMPGILLACPKVLGRSTCSFSRASCARE